MKLSISWISQNKILPLFSIIGDSNANY